MQIIRTLGFRIVCAALLTCAMSAGVIAFGVITGEHRQLIQICIIVGVGVLFTLHWIANDIPNERVFGPGSVAVGAVYLVWSNIAAWLYVEVNPVLFYAISAGLVLVFGWMIWASLRKSLAVEAAWHATEADPLPNSTR